MRQVGSRCSVSVPIMFRKFMSMDPGWGIGVSQLVHLASKAEFFSICPYSKKAGSGNEKIPQVVTICCRFLGRENGATWHQFTWRRQDLWFVVYLARLWRSQSNKLLRNFSEVETTKAIITASTTRKEHIRQAYKINLPEGYQIEKKEQKRGRRRRSIQEQKRQNSCPLASQCLRSY